MKATSKKIIIQFEKKEFHESNGIIHHNSILPETEGIVISTGPLYQGELKENDKVSFKPNPGEYFEHNKKNYYVVNESAINGIINT